MKKRYLSYLLGSALFLLSTGKLSAQQLAKPMGKTKINATTAGFSSNLPNYNPNPGQYHQPGHKCMSDALMEDYLQQTGKEQWYANEQARMNYEAQNFQGSRVAYTIPVVFHVIYSNGSENVSNALIQQLLDELNEDYQLMNSDAANARSAFGFVPANADVSFCLAMRDPQNQPLAEPGVHRVSTSVTYFDPDVNTNDMKYTSSGGTEAWNRNNYLNVWICDITNGATFGTAGYAYKPGISSIGIPSDIDGIVIDYNIGTTANSNVLTHEVGHYLGLSHTWGNSNQAAGCSDDDGLSDTPNTAGPSFDYTGSCTGNQTTCGTTQTMYENYMDYSNCTCMFTTEQVNLMTSVLANSRNSLASSIACTPVNPQPPVALIYAPLTTIGQGGVVNLYDQSTNYPTSWSWSVNPSTGVTFLNAGGNTDQDVTIQFANTGTYTVTLTATNAQGSDDDTEIINVVASGGGSTACDTLRNYNVNDPYYTLTAGTGYILGNTTVSTTGPPPVTYNITQWAEPYNASSPTEVRQLRFVPSAVNDGGGSVIFKVYQNAAGPEPGTVIQSQSVPLANLVDGFWNVVDFTTPASVTGDFWVGYEVSYANAADTFALLGNAENAPVPTNYTMMYVGSGFNTWFDVDAIYANQAGDPLGTAFIMDVLTSNGPAPTAALSISATTVCEGVPVSINASGSVNATTYIWDFYEGGNYEGYLDGVNPTFGFWQGSWDVDLLANGSCMTDVASTSFTVNPELTTTHSATSENCNASDGGITFSGTAGGDGGPYNYSINSGATSQTATAFTGLTAGTYNILVTDGSGCEYTSTQNVTRVNNFSVTASATPGTTINQGQSVTLDATAGGTSYTWFEGNVTIASSQSTSASPQVTTTYIVNAIDANGCEASDQITITVILGLDDSEIGKYVNVFPNPSNGTINLAVGFEASKNITVEILNMFGQVIETRNIQGVSSGIYQFDLSNESEGFYLMRINDGNEMFTTRISKID